MTIERKVLAPAFALAALVLMMVPEGARATHPRPKGGSPVRVPLVPAYEQCTSPNRMHGGPLASPSCDPPLQTSSFLTVGTPDANGAAANSMGFTRVRVKVTSPEDVLFSLTVSDVRCRPATDASVCRGANDQAGPDYVGDVQSNATMRITDHFNGPIGGSGGTDPATLVDIPFPVNVPCASTADTTTGSLCSIVTSSCVEVCGQQWFEGKRVNVEFGQFQVYDGGADGIASTQDNTLFMDEGIFAP